MNEKIDVLTEFGEFTGLTSTLNECLKKDIGIVQYSVLLLMITEIYYCRKEVLTKNYDQTGGTLL